MTDRAELERRMNGPIQRTCWMSDDPCPRCSGTLATNGRSSWCVANGCGYAVNVKPGKPAPKAPTPEGDET